VDMLIMYVENLEILSYYFGRFWTLDLFSCKKSYFQVL